MSHLIEALLFVFGSTFTIFGLVALDCAVQNFFSRPRGDWEEPTGAAAIMALFAAGSFSFLIVYFP